MRIRSFLLVAGVAGLLLQAAPVLAAESAADFIAQAGNSVLTLARDRSLSEAELKQRLGAIAEKDFDAPRIAKFVLGRYWRTASEAERQQFIQAFENYMVQVYASRFRQYGGAQFKVTGERQDGQTSMVTTDIAQPNGQPAHVMWEVVQTPSGYKIIDVSIEGISQAVTYRQEFSSVIEQNGGRIAALTQQLRQKANS